MMESGYILSSIEEYVYFIGLLPCEVMSMTLSEINKIYSARMKRIELENNSADRRTARICCILANINRDTKKKRNPFVEDDFIPKKEEKEKEKEKKTEQSIEQMASILRLITRVNGGKVPK